MKILRLSAMALAAALGYVVSMGSACPGTNNGSNINANSGPVAPIMNCPNGGVPVNGQCYQPEKATTR